jgi:uncharacterized sporulation protein YeaH/YhbH (DUF444 family)
VTAGGIAARVVRQRVVPSEVRDLPTVSVFIPEEVDVQQAAGVRGRRIEISKTRLVIAVLQARPASDDGTLEDEVDDAIAQIRNRLADRIVPSAGTTPFVASDLRLKRVQTSMSTGSANAVVVTVLDYEAVLHTREGTIEATLPRRGA